MGPGNVDFGWDNPGDGVINVNLLTSDQERAPLLSPRTTPGLSAKSEGSRASYKLRGQQKDMSEFINE